MILKNISLIGFPQRNVYKDIVGIDKIVFIFEDVVVKVRTV